MTHRPDGSSVLAQGELAGWSALLAVLAGTILLSALTWRFVEVPGQRLGRGRRFAPQPSAGRTGLADAEAARG